MAIEKISKRQQLNAKESKANSDAGLAQKVAFAADDASRKTVAAADLAKQAAAKVPDALIAGLQVAIESMLTVINGYQNPKDLTFKPYPLIMKIIKSLSDVIIQLSAMQVQAIPGLAKVNALLTTLSIAAKTLDSNNKNNVPGGNPELSPELMNTIQDLLVATQSLCDVIPLVMLKLVFEMFNGVIMCFKQIMPHNYGLPIIPPPLITAPICSSIMPSIIDFVTTFNSQVSNATYGVMRKAMKQVQDAQIPLPSPPIVDAQYLPAAPGRDAQVAQPSLQGTQSVNSIVANKIFTFGKVEEPGAQKELPQLEKYKDVSMLAKTVMDSNGGSPKIAKSVNIKAVRNSIHNIFTWIPGERILLPEFGSRLYLMLYEGITPLTEERIIAEIRSCMTEWEPRAQIVEIRNASNIDDTEDNTIHIEVVFTIPSLSDEQYIYSFTYDMPQ